MYSAYNNDENFKQKLIEMVKKRQEVDGNIIGSLGEDHEFLAKKMSVPLFITKLHYVIFENVSGEVRKTWTVDLLDAIKIGSDLSPILPKFLLFILSSAKINLQDRKFKEQLVAVEKSENLLNSWIETGVPDKSAARLVALLARLATWSAWLAASAGRSVESPVRLAARSAGLAELVVRSVELVESAELAELATRSIESAVRLVVRSVESAELVARVAAYDKFAIKFLELIRECD